MAKKTRKIESLTTPGFQMQARSWIAELVVYRANNGNLPPKFWQQQKWKWRYANEVKAATKFIKSYGESTVLRVVLENKNLTTLSSYGDIEYLLQVEQEKLERLKTPKDTSDNVLETRVVGTDLRESNSFKPKPGLFEILNAMENDNG